MIECNRCHKSDTTEIVIATFKDGDSNEIKSQFIRVICNDCGQEFTEYRLFK